MLESRIESAKEDNPFKEGYPKNVANEEFMKIDSKNPEQNPFKDGYQGSVYGKGKSNFSVRQLIADQIDNMKVGESKKIDNHGKPSAFRKGISLYAKNNNKAFRTQKDMNYDTWVLRVS